MSHGSQGLVLALGLAAVMLLGSVGSASAADCSDPHCYGRVRWNPAPDNHGGRNVLNVSCLYLPDPRGHFVTAEMWVARDGWWVEHGMSYGAPYGATRVWFWADNRPGYGYREALADVPHALNTDYGNRIQLDQDHTDRWDLVHSGTFYATSKDSFSAPSDRLFAGVETTTLEARVIVRVKDLGWQTTGGGWEYPWAARGVADPTLQNTAGLFNIDWITRNESVRIKLHAAQC